MPSMNLTSITGQGVTGWRPHNADMSSPHWPDNNWLLKWLGNEKGQLPSLSPNLGSHKYRIQLHQTRL